jgi:hypothetical protein
MLLGPAIAIRRLKYLVSTAVIVYELSLITYTIPLFLGRANYRKKYVLRIWFSVKGKREPPFPFDAEKAIGQ